MEDEDKLEEIINDQPFTWWLSSSWSKFFNIFFLTSSIKKMQFILVMSETVTFLCDEISSNNSIASKSWGSRISFLSSTSIQ